MQSILAICRSVLVAALAVGLTATPLCAAASESTRSSAAGAACHAHGTNALVVVSSNRAAPLPTKVEAAYDQGDDYDAAQSIGAADSVGTILADPTCLVAHADISRGAPLSPHSLVAQRTCLRL